MVNVRWSDYERMVENGEFTCADFWEQPLWRWGAMFTAGVRASFVGSQHAARVLLPREGRIHRARLDLAAQKYMGKR